MAMEVSRKLVFHPDKFEQMKNRVDDSQSIRATAADFVMSECMYLAKTTEKCDGD